MQAGLPAGVLNIIHVDPKDAPAVSLRRGHAHSLNVFQVSEAIIAHPAVG